MNKPKNYENTQAGGDVTPIELGGHILEIKQVEEVWSRSGKPMIKIFFDFAREDKQSGYFAEQYKNDIRPERKWPDIVFRSEEPRLNSSHHFISYAVFCLKKKKKKITTASLLV